MEYVETNLTRFDFSCGGKDFVLGFYSNMTDPFREFLEGRATAAETYEIYQAIFERIEVNPNFISVLEDALNMCGSV